MLYHIVIMIILYKLLFNVSLFQILNKGRASNLTYITDRTYYLWIGYNLWHFFLFTGTAISFFFALRVYTGVKKIFMAKNFSLSDAILFSFITTLLALNFSGQNLGEVARLWIFLSPLVVLLAMDGVKRELQKITFFTIMFCQFIQAVIFKLFVDVNTL